METYQLKHKGEEIDAILDKAKAADPLEDLAEIREGASKGATAVQPEEIEPLATKVELSDAVQGMKTYIDEKDVETFNLARSYTDDAIAALYNGVVEAEEVTAAALVSLDERVSALSENVAGEAATKTEVEEAVAAINATIVENEEITAAALVDLNTRLAALEAAIANL